MAQSHPVQSVVVDDRQAVETAFLMVLTRLPSDAERELFVPRLAEHRDPDDPKKVDEKARQKVMTDLVWCLLNTTEFSWLR